MVVVLSGKPHATFRTKPIAAGSTHIPDKQAINRNNEATGVFQSVESSGQVTSGDGGAALKPDGPDWPAALRLPGRKVIVARRLSSSRSTLPDSHYVVASMNA